MNTPSIKTLLQVFPDPVKAKEAKRILSMENTGHRLKEYESVETYRRACHNPPSVNSVKMIALDELAETQGVEAFESEKGEFAEYLNTGDTYETTILLWRGRFRVTTVGDFVETSKEKFK